MFTLKIFYEAEIRRVSFDQAPTWDQLIVYLRSILGPVYHPELPLRYVDEEGDLVSFSSQMEWESIASQPKGNLIKLYVGHNAPLPQAQAVQPQNEVLFKDGPAPETVEMFTQGTNGTKNALPINTQLSGSLQKCLENLFPDGKILPLQLPTYLRSVIRLQRGPSGAPDDISLDVDIENLTRTLHKEGLAEIVRFSQLRKEKQELGPALEMQANYHYETSKKIFQSLLLWNEKDFIAYYNWACLEALKGDKDLAITLLQKAIDSGYVNFEHIATDEDLISLHSEAAFQVLLQNRPKGSFQEPMHLDTPAPAPAPAPVPVPVSVPVVANYDVQVEELRSLGFQLPREGLVELLQVFNGDVHAVVNILA